jgi:type I restriction enzyme S subunit
MAGEWTTATIGDAFDLVTGYAFKSSDFIDHGVPVIKIKNVKAGEFSEHEFSYVSDSFLRGRGDKQAKHGDLLVSMSGNRHDGSPETWVGKIAQFRKSGDYLINQRVGALRLKKNAQVDSRFASYLLSSFSYQELFIAIATSSGGQANLSPAQILGAPMRYPDIDSQRAIAHILGTLDDKIELNRRMNETLEDMARALFKSWFVDFDPVRAKAEGRDPGLPKQIADLFPARLVESELGKIPEGWEVATIGQVAEVIDCLHSRKPERQESGLPLLQLTNIRDDGLLDMTDTYLINEENYRQWISRMEASQGDCLITNVGRVGAVAQIPAGQKAALGRNMTGVRCRRDFPFPTVLIEALLSSAMKDEMTRKMDTGTILNALNVRNIPRLRFVKPTSDVLALFEQSCRPIRARMETLLANSCAIADLRDTLLPKLISGLLRVRDVDDFLERRQSLKG